MTTDPTPRGSRSRRLPPYRALLAVDVRRFSGYQGADQAALTERIKPIVGAAFRRCGLGDVWEEDLCGRVIGDSYVGVFPSATLPLLLDPFLRALQVQLEHENRESPVGYRAEPVRMRVSVHVGAVTDPSADPTSDGSGEARVALHRLLEADAVKDVLEHSDHDTCVAAIVSERVFADAVTSGYVGESPGRYRRVEVRVKQYRGVGYLRVPDASGDLLSHGLGSPAPDGGQDDTAAQPTEPTGSVTGIGSVTGSAHNVVTGTHGPVTIGGDRIDDPDHRRRGRRRDG